MRVPSTTFAYAPDIAVYVMDQDEKPIDLSSFVESWQLQRNTSETGQGAMSRFVVQLANPGGRWERRIPRMARIVVFLKRVRWLQEFSGYVTSAPYLSAVPRSATVVADCTMKRILYTYWDPHTLQAQELFPQLTPRDYTKTHDGGAAAAMFRLLTRVGGWQKGHILIQKIPESFIKKAAALGSKMKKQVDPRAIELFNEITDALGVSGAGTSSNPNPQDAVDAGVYQGKNVSPILGGKVTKSCARAERMIKARFPDVHSRGNLSVRSVRGGTGWSQHAYANASDLYRGKDSQTPTPKYREMWKWVKENAAALQIDFAVFDRQQIQSYNGYVVSVPSSTNIGNHQNHMHLDYLPHYVGDPPGRPDNSTKPTNTPAATSAGGGSPFNVELFAPGYQEMSDLLTGIRAWSNDESLMDSVNQLCNASMREFQSAPNGNFVAWYPDMFGFYGKSALVKIRDVEIKNFALQVSDENLTTHVLVKGDTFGGGTLQWGASTGTVDELDWLNTYGIVTIEQTEIMKLLLGLDPDKNYTNLPGRDYLQRFGLRPHTNTNASAIRDHMYEFTLALHVFMRKWSEQFQHTLGLTFMPELYPGMRIELVDRGIALYVKSVTHRGSRSEPWTTDAVVTAPMRKVNGQWVMLSPEQSPVEKKKSAADKVDD